MAEFILSSLIEGLANRISNQIRLAIGDEGHARKLQIVLTKTQAALNDSEDTQLEDETTNLMLKDLRQVVSEAEDVLGEFAYEATKKKVRTFFYISNPIGFKVQEITGKLNQIDKEKKLFGFDREIAKKGEFAVGRETFSFVDDSRVVGRETDKSKIVDMLLVSNQEIRVICIVGGRGLGKTTVAKLVYNEEWVKMHFSLRMWVWVSHDFDQRSVLIQMLEQISNQRYELSSLDEMMGTLREGLRDKRFLLVLDDVCVEDSEVWDYFENLSRFGAVGSRVIVTAPSKASKAIASFAGAQMYHLEALSEEECWALFERETLACGRYERAPDFERIRRSMVKRCGGFPLAVKTISGFMRSKKEEHEQIAAMNCEIWNIPIEENKIIKALKWTYDALPTQVKQCLLYFGTFPKNHWVAKETLVQLWMAQGYVKESSPMLAMEDVDRCIDILQSKFFIEVVEKKGFGDISLCKVHLLAHDLAKVVNGTLFRTFNDDNQIFEEDLSECQHLSLTYNGTESSILEFSPNMKKLRSLFLRESHGWGDDHMATFVRSSNSKSLRVLDLSSTSIKRLKLPIDKLKNLKYLDLSCTDIEELPEFVTQLYNLQTLRLEQCKRLEKLPDDLPILVNLRHLHIDTSGKWEEMPRKMDRLSNLQILPIFILSKEDPGRSIKELERLENLRGILEIFHLEDAESKMFTKKGILRERKNVHTLSLHWSDVRRGKNFRRLLELLDDEHDNDVAVLERLQPHSNLKELRIRDFRGAEFPTWLTTGSELPRLVEMHICGCYKLERIPCFGELPSLKVLHMHDLKKLKCLGVSLQTDRDQGISNEQGLTVAEVKTKALYPSLKKLVLIDLPDLEEWLDDAGLNSPTLEQLTIRKCPKLRKTPNSFHSLKRLVFKEVNGMGISSITSCLSSLISLSINGCDDVQYLSEVVLSNNNLLESLSIAHCSYFQGFLPIPEGEEILASVRLLKINDCCKLFSLDLHYFVYVRELIVSNCKELKSLEGLQFLTALEKFKIGPLSQRLHSFPFAIEAKHLKSLRDLRISGWPNIMFLPDQLQHLTTLKFLWIRDFNGLTTLPDWLDKLSSLQRLVIQNCQNIMQLPPEEDLKILTSLMKLYIGNCPLLQEVHNLRTAEAEWTSISQFPVVKFEVPSHLVW